MYIPPTDLFLQGAWYNELGSTLNITQSETGQLVGNFKTGVESTKGAAGLDKSPFNININTINTALPCKKCHVALEIHFIIHEIARFFAILTVFFFI